NEYIKKRIRICEKQESNRRLRVIDNVINKDIRSIEIDDKIIFKSNKKIYITDEINNPLKYIAKSYLTNKRLKSSIEIFSKNSNNNLDKKNVNRKKY
ncbi:1627_t:CDS:1, partial [Funneliformis caledonium]